MDCLLGIDVGSTSMKALIYDTEGNVLSQASRPQVSIANDPAHPNWQVYLPESIWEGIASAIHDAVSQLELERTNPRCGCDRPGSGCCAFG